MEDQVVFDRSVKFASSIFNNHIYMFYIYSSTNQENIFKLAHKEQKHVQICKNSWITINNILMRIASNWGKMSLLSIRKCVLKAEALWVILAKSTTSIMHMADKALSNPMKCPKHISQVIQWHWGITLARCKPSKT